MTCCADESSVFDAGLYCTVMYDDDVQIYENPSPTSAATAVLLFPYLTLLPTQRIISPQTV